MKYRICLAIFISALLPWNLVFADQDRSPTPETHEAADELQLGTLDFTTAAVTSGSVQVSESTVSALDTSNLQNIVIYAGYTGQIGECASTTTAVCNSCKGAGAPTSVCSGGVYACAERSIRPDLNLTITMALAALPGATPSPRAEVVKSGGNTQVSVSPSSTVPTAANQQFTVYIPWSEICAKMGSGVDCLASFQGELLVGLSDGAAGSLAAENAQKFTIKFSYADPAAASNRISPPTTDPLPSQEGVTDFSVLPGDEKVYLRDIWRGNVGPNTGTYTRWKALRVFFAEDTNNFCDIDISADGGYADLTIVDPASANLDTQLGQEYVDGLVNEVDYMFTAASVDQATVVSNFIDVSTGADPTRYRATPGDVVGLLDQQKCFVATAAYGSPMDSKVVVLRQLRDQVLSKFSIGKDFVRFYYRHSTQWARWLESHPQWKPVVRLALAPIVFVAEIIQILGLSIFLSLLTGLMVGFVYLVFFRKPQQQELV